MNSTTDSQECCIQMDDAVREAVTHVLPGEICVVPIHFAGRWVLYTRDEGVESSIPIDYCPWCGHRLRYISLLTITGTSPELITEFPHP